MINTLAALNTDAVALLPELIALRRAIHAEPELGLHTPKTTARVKAALAGLPLDFRQAPSTTGLIATLHGSQSGRTVLLRGDMDALPLTEDTGLDYASTISGQMHACGHDSHTAMLVGAAKLLCARREQLSGTIMLMFQPGEEGFHGARFMLDDGLLDPLPDAAFALHIMPNGEHGKIAGRIGALMASADTLRITVTGRGGHASMPHDAVDPVPIACEIVSAIQSMITRQISVFDPAVITISQISAGTTHNIIPDTAHLLGTIRTLSPHTRAHVHQALEQLATGIALAHGAAAAVEVEQGFPVTVCDGAAVRFGQDVAESMFGPSAWQSLANPIMGAEDFAYILEKVPGAMFFLGASHADSDWRSCCPIHSNRMILDESVMARGSAFHAGLAMRFLSEGFGRR